MHQQATRSDHVPPAQTTMTERGASRPLLLALLLAGCGQSHGTMDAAPDGSADATAMDAGPAIGSPCEPPDAPEGGWRGPEVFVSPYVADCIGGPAELACMVYKLEGDLSAGCVESCADPEQAAARVLCTLDCSGDGSCPTGFVCEQIFGFAPEIGYGTDYCVPEAIAGTEG